MATFAAGAHRLSDINPHPKTSDLLDELIPPREFTNARFSNYVPDPAHPSQQAALDAAKTFTSGKRGGGLFAKRAEPKPGIYFDGGFGVGKTHLLASVYHDMTGRKAFGSFMQFTSLVGALGFGKTIEKLASYNFIAIDEFELDDPGDTMIMSRLLNELGAKGVRFAATSNTPPNALGDGRFAAADFLREIQGIGAHFEMLRVDGDDYRHRAVGAHSEVSTGEQLAEVFATSPDPAKVAVDDFATLLNHLSRLHPSKYGLLLKNVDALLLTDVARIDDQSAAIRFVSFIDRAYESQVQIRNSGQPLTDVFRPDHLEGGYKKKYLRAISRIGSMTSSV